MRGQRVYRVCRERQRFASAAAMYASVDLQPIPYALCLRQQLATASWVTVRQRGCWLQDSGQRSLIWRGLQGDLCVPQRAIQRRSEHM